MMNERIMARMVNMIVGSLQYYASESKCDEDGQETADVLESLAVKILDDSATEEEWMEAIDQVDISDI